MAVSEHNTSLPEHKTSRRALLAGGSAAFAAAALPAVASATPAAIDWRAIHAELKALFEAEDAIEARIDAARGASLPSHCARRLSASGGRVPNTEWAKWVAQLGQADAESGADELFAQRDVLERRTNTLVERVRVLPVDCLEAVTVKLMLFARYAGLKDDDDYATGIFRELQAQLTWRLA